MSGRREKSGEWIFLVYTSDNAKAKAPSQLTFSTSQVGPNKFNVMRKVMS